MAPDERAAALAQEEEEVTFTVVRAGVWPDEFPSLDMYMYVATDMGNPESLMKLHYEVRGPRLLVPATHFPAGPCGLLPCPPPPPCCVASAQNQEITSRTKLKNSVTITPSGGVDFETAAWKAMALRLEALHQPGVLEVQFDQLPEVLNATRIRDSNNQPHGARYKRKPERTDSKKRGRERVPEGEAQQSDASTPSPAQSPKKIKKKKKRRRTRPALSMAKSRKFASSNVLAVKDHHTQAQKSLMRTFKVEDMDTWPEVHGDWMACINAAAVKKCCSQLRIPSHFYTALPKDGQAELIMETQKYLKALKKVSKHF